MLITYKPFCQSISGHISGWYIIQKDLAVSDCESDQVISELDMRCPQMISRVLHKSNGTLIIS